MNMSISQELKQTFHLHSLRREAGFQLTGRQWEQHNAISKRCRAATEKEKRLFNERYEMRIAQECRNLINESGSKNRNLKPIGQQDDLFDRASLLKQADTNVRKGHERRIEVIDRYEARKIEELLQRSARVNQHRGQSRKPFNETADRRSGTDRRRGLTANQSRPSRRQSQY
ncbi:MAG: hypothetical protein AAF478_11245 [Pseudomonadota bacterium]